MELEYTKFEKMSLKNHPDLDERWVQECIAEEPGILGLGDVILKDKERRQPRAGRLDLLLQDAESFQRYEVEVQLGATDESHIIRTIEYWDIERKRYPQYEHTAVIVAEDVTSRFLNVVSLFNGAIPLMAIQMNAFKNGDQFGLVFTTVVDQMSLGLVDEDEETEEATDRAYWENRATKQTVAMADELLDLAKQCDDSLELKYNKNYIGLAKNSRPCNVFIVRPKKAWISLKLRSYSPETKKKLEDAGLELRDNNRGRAYFRLNPGDIAQHRVVLTEVVQEAYENSFGG